MMPMIRFHAAASRCIYADDILNPKLCQRLRSKRVYMPRRSIPTSFNVLRPLTTFALGLALLPSSAIAGERAPEVLDVRAPAAPVRPNLRIKLTEYNLNTKMFSFPSGLQVLFQKDSSQPLVAITSVTDHGASDDPVGKEGIAHLVEHLWFRSEHNGLPKTWDLLESEMGCDLNAFTNYDFTVYMTVCPSFNLGAMMKLEALRISDTVANVTQDMVTTEAEVVRNEIRMRSENFNMEGFTVLEYSNQHLYPEGHPYSRPMAGDHTTIRNITIEDVQKFTEAYYRPETTTVTVIGDFEEDSFAYYYDLIVRSFDPKQLHPDLTDEDIRRYPREGVTNPDPNKPDDWWFIAMDPDNPDQYLPILEQKAPRREAYSNLVPAAPASKEFGVYEAPVKAPTAVLTWTLPPSFQGNDLVPRIASSIVNYIMNYGFAVSNEPKIKVLKGCFPMDGKQGTSMICFADLNTKSEREAEMVANRMMDQIASAFDPSLREQLLTYFSQARMEIMAEQLQSIDLFAAVGSGRATEIGQFAHMTNQAQYHAARQAEINKITAEEVIGFIEKYLTRKQVARLMLLPEDRDEVALLSADTAGAGGHFRGGEEKSILNPSTNPAAITAGYLRDKTITPDLSKMDEFILPNGMRVVAMPHGDSPIMKATLISHGGSAQDPTGLLDFAYKFSNFDTSVDPLQIAGSYTGGMGQMSDSFGITASAGNLEDALWLLRHGIDGLKPDLDGSGSYLRGLKKGMVGAWRSEDWHIRDMRNQHLNPDHILNRSMTFEDIDRLSKFKAADVQRVLNEKWHPENTTLLLVGNLSASDVRSVAIEMFGGWRADAKGKDPVIDLPDIPPPNEGSTQKIYVFDDEGKTQTQVTLACPIQTATEVPSSPAHELLGDLGRLTLFARLREEAGVVYSPYAGTFVSPGGTSALFMQAAIQNDSAVFAMEQYLRFIEEVKDGAFNENDLRMKKLTRAISYVTPTQSVQGMSSRLTTPIAYDQDFSVFDEYAEALAGTSKGNIATLVDDCAEHAFISFKGPKDVISEALEAGGYEFEVVDWEQRGRDLWAEADPKAFEKAEKKRLKAEAKKAEAEAKKEAEGEGESEGDDEEETE